ncbi:hypothetical protein LVJ94_07860 [Pendulispora rubella]|uniref:FHA domain-containing protein n=1 Tax=Pendulispora rubella TaxID=2741070 RepID=A0ABZ2L886_9BACT
MRPRLAVSMTHPRVLKYVLSPDEGAEMLFYEGESRDPFSVGRAGAFHVEGRGVLDVHAFVHFDGQRLFMCSTDSVSPVLVDGAPLQRRWSELTPPCHLRFGAAAASLRGPDGSLEVPPELETTALDLNPPPDSLPFEPTQMSAQPAQASGVVRVEPPVALGDSDATRVWSIPPPPPAPAPAPPSAPPPHSPRPMDVTQISLARRDARRKVAVAASIFVVVTLLASVSVVFARLWIQRHRPRPQPVATTVSAAAAPVPAPVPSATPLPTGIAVHPAPPVDAGPPPPPKGPVTPTLERSAVDAFQTGDLPKALQLYERLASENPDNPAFGNTVRILRQRSSAPPSQ